MNKLGCYCVFQAASEGDTFAQEILQGSSERSLKHGEYQGIAAAI